jgi:hypothetical protein
MWICCPNSISTAEKNSDTNFFIRKRSDSKRLGNMVHISEIFVHMKSQLKLKFVVYANKKNIIPGS